MRFTLTFLSTLLATTVSAELLVRAQDSCTPGNNCQRAVGGTRFNDAGLAQRTADCSSYQLYTITTTVGGTLGSDVTKPTNKPEYASACDKSGEYSSACSCIGIVPSTTTVTEGPEPTKCNANNCARAVTGTFRGLETQAGRSADCVSYFKATVTSTPGGGLGPVITPTNVPDYASACDKPGEYSSACSCFGLSPITTTVIAIGDYGRM